MSDSLSVLPRLRVPYGPIARRSVSGMWDGGRMSADVPIGIKYPCAELDGELVWAADLKEQGERPAGLTCVGCNAAVGLRAGKQVRPHFAHRSRADACSAGETVLHSTAVRVMAAAIRSAMSGHRQYPILVRCTRCDTERPGDLARWAGGSVAVDRVFRDGVRPDLLILDGSNQPRFVVEVIVSHAPEEQSLSVYRSAGLPVITVWPTWETIIRLRDGLGADDYRRIEWLRSAYREVGIYSIVDPPCNHPRHSHEGLVSCQTCDNSARLMGIELAQVTCWKCHRLVPVLDVVDHSGSSLRSFAASDASVVGLGQISRSLGVDLRMDHSRTASTDYLMHHCRHCGAKQGDFFCYGSEAPTVSPGAPIRYFTACPDGHWIKTGERSWDGWPPQRRVPKATGDLWGMAGSSAATNGISPHQAARIMTGLDHFG